MKLTYDAATEAFRSQLQAWLDANTPTQAETLERPESSGHLPEWARRWQKRLFDAGWLVPGWPPELGGRNASSVEQMVYFEELARRRITRSFNIQGLSIIAPSIVEHGTTEQRNEYVLPVLRAEKTACVGMSEPGAGSDLAALSTTAEDRGDHWLVNGQKVWTSGAQDADFCCCFVRTDPAAPKHKGISALLIDMSTPGISVRRLPGLTNPDRADFNEVFFSDVTVPKDKLLGALNDGWRIANGSLGHERAMLWILQAANLERGMTDLLTLLGEVDHQSVRDEVARLYTDTHALWLLGYRGFAKLERRRVPLEHAILKVFGTEAVRRLTLLATEALGAKMIDLDLFTGSESLLDFSGQSGPWAHRYLTSFSQTIAGGTSEIQRNIIAERVLGLPRG
ncbi:MAG: acyl-CoA dehydrogenase family protein [Acidimicrobiales bacterium]